jgi:hypothetical protein
MAVEADLPKRAESWQMRFMAPRASGVEEDAPFSLPAAVVSLHATSKGWATMTVNHPTEGAGLFVA